MMWHHVAAKAMKEVLRQPVAAATILGLPIVMMLVFGSALPEDDSPSLLEQPQVMVKQPPPRHSQADDSRLPGIVVGDPGQQPGKGTGGGDPLQPLAARDLP